MEKWKKNIKMISMSLTIKKLKISLLKPQCNTIKNEKKNYKYKCIWNKILPANALFAV